jgi:hypothetical protein
MSIDIRMPAKCLAVGHANRGRRASNGLNKVVEQPNPRVHGVAGAIPLDHRELGIVQRAAFAAAKRSRDLIDCRQPLCQQPLHMQFR